MGRWTPAVMHTRGRTQASHLAKVMTGAHAETAPALGGASGLRAE